MQLYKGRKGGQEAFTVNFKLCCVHGNCDRTYNVVVRSQTELDTKNSLIMYMYILISVSIVSMLLSIDLLCY